MDIKKVVDLLPESVKYETMNFEDVMLKDGRPAMRVTMCRLLTDDVLIRWRLEKQGVAVSRELPKSYLYFTGTGRENIFREGF